MDDRGTTVFVEVKLRRNDRFGSAREALSSAKLNRLTAAAEAYCAQHPERTGPIRFDVVTIDAIEGRAQIRHLRNVDTAMPGGR